MPARNMCFKLVTHFFLFIMGHEWLYIHSHSKTHLWGRVLSQLGIQTLISSQQSPTYFPLIKQAHQRNIIYKMPSLGHPSVIVQNIHFGLKHFRHKWWSNPTRIPLHGYICNFSHPDVRVGIIRLSVIFQKICSRMLIQNEITWLKQFNVETCVRWNFGCLHAFGILCLTW